jgi:hypothetical protein
VLQQFNDVENHVDVGAGLALAGDWRAVDNLETGTQEGMTISLVPVWIQVATAHQQSPSSSRFMALRDAEGFDHPANPLGWLPRKALRSSRLQDAQLRVNVVKVDEQSTFHGSSAAGPDVVEPQYGGQARFCRPRFPTNDIAHLA